MALLLLVAVPVLAQPVPTVVLPKTALEPAQLAVVVNELDPVSVRIGRYYCRRRGVPDTNLLRVRFGKVERFTMDRETFARLRFDIRSQTTDGVQAYLLVWPNVARVECMSVTAAMALGFDHAYCAQGCQPTKPSPYYNHRSRAPWDDLGIRPAMSLPLKWDEAKTLIDRSVAADESWPQGTGYLLETSDNDRNVRARYFSRIISGLDPLFPLLHVESNTISGRRDVFFYFTGRSKVRKLDENTVLPGAVGDNLTSFSGFLSRRGRKRQTNVLDFLQAGFSGSYGTVVEPCNFVQKFSDPMVLMSRYLHGESLLEAYWKSVRWPGQGLFAGDPLTNPFGGAKVRWVDNYLLIAARNLEAGNYDVWTSADGLPPYRLIAENRAVAGYPQYIMLPREDVKDAQYVIVRPSLGRENASVQR